MKTTGLSLTLLAASLLTACGGGGSGDVTTGTGGNGGSTTRTFQANVVQDTVCGTSVSSSNAELLIHDQDWRVISRHRANAAGIITATVTGAAQMNISTIAVHRGENPEIQVASYAQHPVGDLGTLRVPGKAQQGCECRLADVKVVSPFGSLTPSTIELTGYNRAEQRRTAVAFGEVTFSDVELCRTTNGNWPVLNAIVNGGTVNAIAGSVRQYNPSTEITLPVTQTPSIVPVSVAGNYTTLGETHYTETGILGLRSRLNSSETFIFNQLDGVEFVSVRASSNQFDQVDNSTVFRSAQQRQAFDLPFTQPPVITIPNNDAQAALERFLVQDLPSDNTNYNLGTIQGFNTFYLYVSTTLTDNTQYLQTFIGPLQGKYPDEIVPTDYAIADKFNDNAPSTVSASVIRYGDSQSYQQYLLDNVERSKLPFEARMTGKWAKYSSVNIQVTTR